MSARVDDGSGRGDGYHEPTYAAGAEGAVNVVGGDGGGGDIVELVFDFVGHGESVWCVLSLLRMCYPNRQGLAKMRDEIGKQSIS